MQSFHRRILGSAAVLGGSFTICLTAFAMYEGGGVGSLHVLTQAAHVLAGAILTASNHYCHTNLLHGPLSRAKFRACILTFFCALENKSWLSEILILGLQELRNP